MFSTAALLLLMLSQTSMAIRDVPDKTSVAAPMTGMCRNTIQGLLYITDDRGIVCLRDDLDYQSGCCKKGEKHSCSRCSATDKCCTEYEHCVSCCLAPHNEAEKLAPRTLKAPKFPEAGMWADAWGYCAGVCRTHGRSTVHENAYISPRHHCFSALGKPMLSDPLPPGALDGVSLVMSDQQESCEAACARAGGGKRCSAQHLPLLNTCDRLREKVNCEAGCEPHKLPGGSAPGYVDPTAQKAARPAMCFTAPAADLSSLSCSGRDQNVRRLCPCA